MKTIVIAILLTTLATAGYAQTGEKRKQIDPDQAAKQRTEKMIENGIIDENQRDAVYAIHLDQAKKKAALREEQKATMAPFKEQHKAIRAETDERLRGVLTDEQMDKMKAHREARQKEMKDFRKHRKDSHMKGDGHQHGLHKGIKHGGKE